MTRERFDAPDHLRDRIASHQRGEVEPVVAKLAATVVLLRDSPSGLEVYLLLRHQAMAFAAGVYVFPGGGVDERDTDTSLGWAGPPPDAWAERLGRDEASARALVCAAVRETYEESGVLLAGRDAESVVADTASDTWEADRTRLEKHELSAAEFLESRDLVLRTDLLVAWAHWITPEIEPRRYDTHFFVAAMPDGQRTRDVSTESSGVTWMGLADAVEGVGNGTVAMMPPTLSVCRDLAAFDTIAEVFAASPDREIPVVLPRFVLEGDDVYLERGPE